MLNKQQALLAVCIIPHHTFFDIKKRIPGWIRAAWWRLYVDFDIVALTDTYRIISDAIIHGPVFDVLRRFDSQMGILSVNAEKRP